MKTIEQYLPEHPFFEGLDPSIIALLAGCAVNTHFDQGDWLFRQGEPADRFYVIRKGRVALEVHSPGNGAQGVVVDTTDEGDVVGWAWLVTPYRWAFDARAMIPTSAIAFDAVCLRDKCAADPAVGYALMQRVSQSMYERMQGARIRLLDLFGTSHAQRR
jgi:CRP/FNR family cyclic AMP-dependent transcriptional regulator